MDNRQRILDSCRDTANDGREFMTAFDDSDLSQMLLSVKHGVRS
jgi:hypothetical protein